MSVPKVVMLPMVPSIGVARVRLQFGTCRGNSCITVSFLTDLEIANRQQTHEGLLDRQYVRPNTARYVLPAQGVIATLRRVSLMVSSRRGFVEAVY